MLDIIIGLLILFSVGFNIICLLDIPAYLKKKEQPIFEFDTISPHDGRKFHITVLEKHNHAYSCETMRTCRMEWLSDSGIPLMSVVYMNEEIYKSYLKGIIEGGQYNASN